MEAEERNALDVSRVRFEIIPIRSKEGKVLLPRNMDDIPKGSKVTITCSEAIGIETTLQAAKRIAEKGYEPVPHIPARMVENTAHLESIVVALKRQGVRDIFVPGGDKLVPVGCFSSALQLLEALNTLPYKFESIGVAAYPQGHPDIPKDILFDALYKKQEYASYAVTQISGSAKAVERWVGDMRQKGITLPVYAGVVGHVDRRRLIRIARNFSLKKVIWFAFKNPYIVFQSIVLGACNPDRIAKAIAYSENIQGIHLNTFNSVKDTEEWRKRFLNS